MVGFFGFNTGWWNEELVSVSFTVRDAAGNAYCHSFLDFTSAGRGFFGHDNVVKLSEILDQSNNILVDGTLIIDMEIQCFDGPDNFQPTNSFAKNMLKLLESEVGADVTIKVENESIPAHKLILRVNAPLLFDFFAKPEDDEIDIKDTSVEVFRAVLKYCYGGDAPDEEQVKEIGRDILIAADRYGVIGLKLAVETTIVEMRLLNVSNVIGWILFADAKTCPLLKEYAAAYFSGRVKDILADESANALHESPMLLNELMVAIADDPNNYINETSRMSVDTLRTLLNDLGEDVDGSKETLIARLIDKQTKILP